MKKIIFLLLATLSLSYTVKADDNGSVVLCESYDDFGAATGIHKNWDIKKEGGGYVYILYSQDKIITQSLSLYIDKKNDNGKYIAFDTETFKYDPKTDKKKFAVYDYHFTEEGDYRITIMGKDELATSYCNIAYAKEEDASEKNKQKLEGKDGKIDTYYYEDSKITFGESINDKAVMTGEAATFNLIKGKRELMCKIQQDKPLKTTKITATLYYGDSYKEKITSDAYTIESLEWDWIKIPITVTKAGKYVLDVYNADDVFVGSGYFEIKK